MTSLLKTGGVALLALLTLAACEKNVTAEQAHIVATACEDAGMRVFIRGSRITCQTGVSTDEQ